MAGADRHVAYCRCIWCASDPGKNHGGGIRVYKQGASTYVIGTEDIGTALAVLGITPETHQWGSTGFGSYVRRQGMWRAVSEIGTPPKDARPGVGFIGRILPRGLDS